jgi:NitT/TauT family transport system substrate-binding protein
MRGMRGWCLVGLLMVGCGTATTTTPVKTIPGTLAEPVSQTLQPLSIALNWFPEAEHGGYYAAVEHGYFAEEGLDVTLLAGGPKAPVIPQVAAGRVPFGVDNADKLLLGRAQEADVIAVFCPIIDSPRCLMLHAGAGIDSFEKLAAAKNFTLAMNPGQPFAQYLTKTLKLDGLTMVPYPGNISQFLLEPRFGQQAYSFSEPFVARQNGATPQLLMLSDLGFNTYTSMLVVSRDTWNSDPALVQKVVRASQRGWQHYLREPDATNARIHAANPEMGLEILAFGAKDLQKYCPAPDQPLTEFGAMTADRWSTLIEQMTVGGSLQTDQVGATPAFVNAMATSP